MEGYHVSSGLGPDVIGGPEFQELVAATMGDLAEVAHVPVGAVVGRRLDQLIWRSEPSGVGEQ